MTYKEKRIEYTTWSSQQRIPDKETRVGVSYKEKEV
jgi:hypothetical protein